MGPSTFVSLAFCLGLIASALCDFVRLDEDNRDRKIFLIESAGLWCHTSTIDGGRYEYSTIQENQVLDDTFDATRSLSLTANILGFVLWLLFLFAGCLKFPPAVFALASCLAMCATLFEGTKIPYTEKKERSYWCFSPLSSLLVDYPGLKFMIFKADVCEGGCELDTGARCSICAIVFYFVSWCMIGAYTKERMDAEKESEPEPEPEQAEEAPEDKGEEAE